MISIALQALVALVFRVPHGTELAGDIVLPMLTALVYAFVAADARAAPPPQGAVWERFLERVWAVIVIDFMLAYLTTYALSGSSSANGLDVVFGCLIFGVNTVLVFADASAVVDDDVTVWNIVPKAFAASVLAAWNRHTFARALAIFSISLFLFALQDALQLLLQQGHVPEAQANFWGQIPLLSIATPPLSALTVLVYLDATSSRKQNAKERV